jgi:PPK2 family polyphosphate:nucleotide phosphotransferase
VDRYRIEPGTKLDLAAFNPGDTAEHPEMDKATARAALEPINARLGELQTLLAAERTHKVLVVLQATDTGGKDGAIKNVFREVNPQGVRVVSFKAPEPHERAHDYLWRIHAHTPADGELTIFNRSHYEDVLIVRVHDLVSKERWSKRYRHITEFEKMLADEGTTILKFFLHISFDEQRRRLQARLDDPHKRWKFNPADLAERERWDDYMRAYEAAIAATSTTHAPWWVVPADHKWYRDLIVTTRIVEALEGLDMKWPDPPDLEGIVIE